jgi:hypothetical protein
LGVNPDVSAELGGRRCQRCHSELIKAKFLRKLSHLLAHRYNICFLLDPDFQCLYVAVMDVGRGK